MQVKNGLKVLVVAETDAHCGRQLIRGIAAYARPEKPWIIRALHNRQNPLPFIQAFRPDGIIIHRREGLDPSALATGPAAVVEVLEEPDRTSPFPLLVMDDLKTGALAADHFLELGIPHFAFAGYANRAYSRRRLEGFRQRLQAVGHAECRTFMFKGFHGLIPREHPPRPETALSKWLQQLPQPCGVFACNDGNACGIMERCQRMQIQIPDELSVLGADNDDLLCLTAYPPLSSIRMPFGRIGYEAARTLDAILSGKAPDAPERICFDPVEVFARRSTDCMAVHDPLVADALRWIKNSMDKPFKVCELAAGLHVSRTLLEQRFKGALNRSPLVEIRRQRIRQAKKLLADSALSGGEIARRCGFNSLIRFSTVFKELAGTPPTEYRRQCQSARTFERT